MAYPTCKVKNIKGETLSLNGKEFSVDEIYQINDNLRVDWSTGDNVIQSIMDENIEVHDANGVIITKAAQIAHLQNY